MGDHPLFAAVYDRMTEPLEVAGLGERRRRLLAPAWGRVLEVGAGTGHNLPHYPRAGIDALTLVEPDGAMRHHLVGRLGDAPVTPEVLAAGIDEVDRPDGSFDTVVATLALCTVPNLDRALARIHRLLTADGMLLFLEHVRMPGWRGRFQQMADPMWTRVMAGCHLDREPISAMRRAGFLVTDCERFEFPLGNAFIGGAVQGSARHDKRRDERTSNA